MPEAPAQLDSPILLATGAMGTRFEVLIAGVEEGVRPESARAAGEEALALVRDWHARLSLFDKASVVSRLNREAAARPAAVDSEIRRLLTRCVRLNELTEGAFDVTAGGLMRRWGFRGDPSETGAGAAEEAACGAIEVDDSAGTVRLGSPGVFIDLGGVAKGAVLDEAVALLRALGVTTALLHGGTSTVAAIGRPPDADGWRVRVGEGPGAPVVELRDAAMSVSSPSGRTTDQGDGTVGHVMDPRTGEPVARDRTVACVGASALDTDAWSTALVVLGGRPSGCPDTLLSIIDEGAGWRVGGDCPGSKVQIPKESPA